MDLGSKQEGKEVFGCREKFVRETSRERERKDAAWLGSFPPLPPMNMDRDRKGEKN